MKIHSVTVSGFGPFRGRQLIDFDRYAADGLFLITGRTGAGKSSILDAICFALYGGVPRYEGAEKRLRSDYARAMDETSVALEMTVGATRWRIERTPAYERPKRSGEGMTEERSTVRIGVVPENAWSGSLDADARDAATDWRATKEREVGPIVNDVVGLSKEQFLQVILLAQGSFAKFLLAENAERQKLLRTLFGSRRFLDYAERLTLMRQESERDLAGLRASVAAVAGEAARIVRAAVLDEGRIEAGDARAGEHDGDADEHVQGGQDDGFALRDDADPTAVRAQIAEWAQRLASGVAAAVDLLDAAIRRRAELERTRDGLRGTREKQQRRTALRERAAGLEAQRAETEAVRDELRLARLAAVVRAPLSVAERASTEAAQAAEIARSARASWRRGLLDAKELDLPPDDADCEVLERFVRDAQRRAGQLDGAVDCESRLAALAQARDRSAAATRDAAAREAALDAEATDLPQTRQALVDEQRLAAERAAGEDGLAVRREAAARTLAAAKLIPERASAYRDAVGTAEAARSTAIAAEQFLAQLHQRRLAGHAGELAEALSTGEECPVCGAREHPHPATRSSDAVTQDEIERAELARGDAARAADAAVDARSAAQTALAELEAQTAGVDASALADELRQVEADLDAAKAARREGERLVEKLTELDAAEASLTERRRVAAVDHSDNRVAEAGAMRAVTEAEESIRASIESYASVRERQHSISTLAAAASDLVVALARESDAERARNVAGDDLAEALRRSAFADADEASAAVRRDADVVKLEQSVRLFDDAVSGVRAELEELAAANLAEEPVALEPAEAELHGANLARDEAASRLSHLKHSAAALTAAAERTDDLVTEIGDRAARAAVIGELAYAVAGRNERRMDLETFVLAAELESVVEAANRRLDEMSQGRYALQHSDAVAFKKGASGLGLDIIDRFTGLPRPTRSLSGGESFLASLALALGLAEIVTQRAGGVALDTLFIDEGFGSLDAETLDTAMRTLDSLREGGRLVGVISHVETMKEQIPAQLRVKRTSGGWSEVRQEASG